MLGLKQVLMFYLVRIHLMLSDRFLTYGMTIDAFGFSLSSRGRLEPNLPLFLPILLSGNARKFYLFFPEIMPASTYFASNYASIYLF